MDELLREERELIGRKLRRLRELLKKCEERERRLRERIRLYEALAELIDEKLSPRKERKFYEIVQLKDAQSDLGPSTTAQLSGDASVRVYPASKVVDFVAEAGGLPADAKVLTKFVNEARALGAHAFVVADGGELRFVRCVFEKELPDFSELSRLWAWAVRTLRAGQRSDATRRSSQSQKTRKDKGDTRRQR